MEDTLKFPVGKIPEFPPKNLPPEVIEAWRTELRLDLHRRGLLEKILTGLNRTPRGPRFRLIDQPSWGGEVLPGRGDRVMV